MPITFYAAGQQHRLRAVRLILEYGLALSAAVLCSYWILEGRW